MATCLVTQCNATRRHVGTFFLQNTNSRAEHNVHVSLQLKETRPKTCAHALGQAKGPSCISVIKPSR